MACAHAKFTGADRRLHGDVGPRSRAPPERPVRRKLDHQPVLAIVGQQKRTSLGAHYQQEIDLQTLFTDVARVRVDGVEPAQARHVIDRAIRIALDRETVCDRHRPERRRRGEGSRVPPRDARLRLLQRRLHTAAHAAAGADAPAAAEILNEGEKVAILIGQGARGAATRSSRSQTSSAPASPRRCSARTCRRRPAVRHRRDRPARHEPERQA